MEYFLSCDWGTSSFRIRMVETSGLRIQNRLHQNDIGFGQLQLSSAEKTALLKEKIDEVCQNLAVPTDLPCIISGMASSSIGIRELPYGKLPVSLNTFSLPYQELEDGLFLISGLADHEDVMRGEEVQILGAFQKIPADNEENLVILPGTHSKHAHLKGNQLLSFKTYLTGELFSLLARHSILRHSLPEEEAEQTDEKAFLKGIEASGASLLHELFAIRARQLLQANQAEANRDFLSGLLIGSELQALQQAQFSDIVLVAEGKIGKLYHLAISKMYPQTQIRLISTEEATILGHFQLIEQLSI